MPRYRSIKVGEEAFGRLLKLKSELSVREGRSLSYSEVLLLLLDRWEGAKA